MDFINIEIADIDLTFPKITAAKTDRRIDVPAGQIKAVTIGEWTLNKRTRATVCRRFHVSTSWVCVSYRPHGQTLYML